MGAGVLRGMVGATLAVALAQVGAIALIARGSPLFALVFAHLLRRGSIARQKIVSKRRVITSDNGGAQLAGKSQHEADIMDATETIIQLFLGSQQVMHIARAIVAAGVAIAARFDGPLLGPETRRFDIDTARVRK